jgi:hypothetical protein
MPLPITLKEYLAYLQISTRIHLLVEGPSDKRLFNELLLGFNYDNDKIDIDSAEELIDLEGIGNRDRVEITCKEVQKTEYKHKLVGFVDREFRGFEYKAGFVDNFACHHVEDRLIWTRGHSIENYFFDLDIFTSILGTFHKIPHIVEASALFSNNFQNILWYACAISLAGYKSGAITELKQKQDGQYGLFTFSHSELGFNDKLWLEELKKNSFFSPQKISKLSEYYKKYIQKGFMTDDEVVRWMCHGHIGFNFLLAAFGACILSACQQAGDSKPEAAVRKFYSGIEKCKNRSKAHSETGVSRTG